LNASITFKRMARFGEFHRRIGEIAAALVVGDEFRHLSDEAVKLATGSPALRFHLRPDLCRLAALVVEIFDDESSFEPKWR